MAGATMAGERASQKRGRRPVAGRLLLGAVLALGAPACSPASEAQRRIEARKDRLLKHTDLAALRDAGRVFIEKHGRSGRRTIPLTDTGIPPIVARLEPTEILVGETFVRIELGGEGYHYGVEIFKSHFHSAAFPTSEQVSDGVWYYENVGKIERAPK
jgi:hypothetical protein